MKPHDGRFRVVLEKEDFRFSAAHFTLFADGSAELLHGHNYQVGIELAGRRLDPQGLLVDFGAVKEHVRRACRRFDGRTLVPEASGVVAVAQNAESVEVVFSDRRYSFPVEDIVLLPVANTSIELLARLLWTELAPLVEPFGVDTLAVTVEETAGQACVFEATLSRDREA